MEIIQTIAQELNHSVAQVKNTVELLAENTIPFITRYRKEATGNLDETQITLIYDRFQYLQELEERRQVILKSIEEQNKLTPELEKQIRGAATKQLLEDLYLPYKPKRRTRATIAKEKGLEPLALLLMLPQTSQKEVDDWVATFNKDKEEPILLESALQGARDIIAEQISEDAETRDQLRQLTFKEGYLISSIKPDYQEQNTKFDMYRDFQEAISHLPAHRYLAMRRGEKEGILRVSVDLPDELVFDKLSPKWLEPILGEMRSQIELAFKDAYARLLAPSIETDIRLELKKQADETSIELFVANLRELLLQAPGGKRVVLGLDPGFRTGTKWIVADKTGKYVVDGVIYPVAPQNQEEAARKTLKELIDRYHIDVIVIGNGTASREVQQFVKAFLKTLENPPLQLMVNESGASVYSASAIAREEFPGLDATVRGAISIARRYQDPLAELVKIDPKSIGVGQYQHDVSQTLLKQSLDRTVVSCVNHVGVDLNTASAPLLTHVSGLSRLVAKKIVQFRDEHGPFKSRADLLKVSGLGKKSYEQAAGFLKIPDADNPLDRSAVHPESYNIVEQFASDHQISIEELIGNQTIIQKLDLDKYVTDTIGLFTLKDISEELLKPGRDPRTDHSAVQFDESVEEVSDLQIGQKLNGVITNITNFGAFVDVGVHQDGLVHVSEMADRYVKDPLEVCRVGQKVTVTVKEVDVERKRISLSMKSGNVVGGKKKKSVPKKEKPVKRNFHSDLSSLMEKFNQ